VAGENVNRRETVPVGRLAAGSEVGRCVQNKKLVWGFK
jgi:hypothetical protein